MNILVLGDSASSTTGLIGRTYLHVLAGQGFDRPVSLIDGSTIGMTSADALLHFKDLAAHAPFDLVLVWLGNCDACGFGFAKPRLLGLLPAKLRMAYNRRRQEGAPLTRRNRPFEFADKSASKAPDACVGAADFEKNLADLARAAHKHGARTLVVAPGFHRRFPPANNLGNFFCYALFGMAPPAKVTQAPGQQAGPLLDALELHATGPAEQALDAYRALYGAAGEQGLIARNNAAALLYAAGRTREALAELDGLPAGDWPMACVAAFNRAVAFERLGDTAKAEHRFATAQAADTGTYRPSPRHMDALARLAKKPPPGLAVLDLSPVLPTHRFVDYCHPDDAGHQDVAARLRQALGDALGLGPGEHLPRLTHRPLNPDRFMGFETTFFEHFGVLAQPRPDFCRAVLQEAGDTAYPDLLASLGSMDPDPGRRSRRILMSHPYFGDKAFLARSQPRENCDQGVLPELYFLRHSLCAHRSPQAAELRAAHPGLTAFLPDPAKADVWWGALNIASKTIAIDELRAMAQSVDPAGVMARQAALAAHLLSAGPVAHRRARSITYWFFREALFWGSASDVSCLYDRMGLYKLAESAALLRLLHGDGAGVGQACETAFALVCALKTAHQAHLAPVGHCLHQLDGERLDAYAAELEGVRTRFGQALRVG